MIPILNLPRVDKTARLEEQVAQMQSQIYQLKEQIEMLLTAMDLQTTKDVEHIKTGLEDFVQSSTMQMDGYKSILKQTASSLEAEVKDAQGNASKALQTATSFSTRIDSAEEDATEALQTATSLEMNVVKKGEVISSINASQEGVAIKGDRISLEGTVTANKNFQIDNSGSMLIDAGGVKISADSDSQALKVTSPFSSVGSTMVTVDGLAKEVGYNRFSLISNSGLGVNVGNSNGPLLLYGNDVRPKYNGSYLARMEDVQGGGDTNADYLIGARRTSGNTYGGQATYYYPLLDTDGNQTSSGNDYLATTGWVLGYLQSKGLI